MEAKKLFIYDWDDNIMFMPSIIHIEKKIAGKWTPIDVSPSQWAKIKNNPSIRYFGDTSFFDFHNDPSFINHLSQAIVLNQFGPAYKALKETLINGEDFAILSARGHSWTIMMTGVMMLIMRTFTDKEIIEMIENVNDITNYLLDQDYFAISSDEFNKRFETYNHQETKDKKSKALNWYINDKINYHNDYNDFIVHFSDDDIDNIEAATELFHELKLTHPNVEFTLFDTSKKRTKEITI